jgi:hypothetical protein
MKSPVIALHTYMADLGGVKNWTDSLNSCHLWPCHCDSRCSSRLAGTIGTHRLDHALPHKVACMHT